MKTMMNLFHSSVIFWLAWIMIPLLMEIIPTIFNFFILIKRKFFAGKLKELTYLPEITLIVPVYNSEDSLYKCIESVYRSKYDVEKIHIMLIDNESKDNSYQVYETCLTDFPELTIHWMKSEQGKSRALNLALFNSDGKYILHIDSDGILHEDAIYNMVREFENHLDVDCVTGTILTNPDEIDETRGFFRRLFLKMEFFEYCQAFLAGRNFQSEFNSIFTMSGAFSAFRKSSILKSQLYNTDTLCEDAHVTFQIRDTMKEKVALCDSAFFFVNPIESINRLYIQRQRWQRGELEVLHMFMRDKMKPVRGFLSNFLIRILMYDHTFAFPRMIWYFALIFLIFVNYPLKLVVESLILIYLLYAFSSLLLYLSNLLFLNRYRDLQWYYARKWYQIFLLPLFNFLVFWFRFAGIINCIRGKQSWKMRDFNGEWKAFTKQIRNDFAWFLIRLEKWQNEVNEEESET